MPRKTRLVTFSRYYITVITRNLKTRKRHKEVMLFIDVATYRKSLKSLKEAYLEQFKEEHIITNNASKFKAKNNTKAVYITCTYIQGLIN